MAKIINGFLTAKFNDKKNRKKDVGVLDSASENVSIRVCKYSEPSLHIFERSEIFF